MILQGYAGNKLTHVAVIGALTSPFIEIDWIQILVWILTCISAIIAIVINVKKLFNKRRTAKNEKKHHR